MGTNCAEEQPQRSEMAAHFESAATTSGQVKLVKAFPGQQLWQADFFALPRALCGASFFIQVAWIW